MADRPIPCKDFDVRSLLAGRKTQTRRVLTPWCEEPPAFVDSGVIAALNEHESPYRWPRTHAIGDRLWVREAHALLPRTAYRGSVGTGTIEQVEHPTDGYTAAVFREGFDRPGRPRWRSATQMPRWISRLTLIVTDVRVQRLQDISEEDAIAEGLEYCVAPNGHVTFQIRDLLVGQTGKRAYRILWNYINGPGAWEANPWVAAYTFTVKMGNIDAA